MADVSGVSSSAPLTASDLNPKPTDPQAKNPNGLGQDDFMKLLVAQMQNQNPLDPQNASDLATQLAQFSSLDGITKLNQNFTSLLLLQGVNQGTNLIGKKVQYQPAPGDEPISGVVESVRVSSGTVNLVVGGQAVPLSQLTQVS
jgi:flagellar basal-body rod modification protein FlgD